MGELRLFDTASASLVGFEPAASDRTVGIYVCGITPYDATHMGHAATYVTYDVLHRYLLDQGYVVQMVRNITDIDDDLLARADRDQVNYLDLAFGQKRQFDQDLEALGVLEPWSEPRATSAIPDVRGLISKLLDEGHAYVESGWVYYSHHAVESFGTIGKYSPADMARIGEQRGEDPADPRKRHPLDTVLWRTSHAGQPEWESPWGSGRPGWHIECTALSIRELGSIDLHGGGCDLVYPHHEFCAAQLLSAGVAPVGHWMHQSCVHLNGEPMSKSTGNLIFVRDLLETREPMVVRLAVLSQHYRSVDWLWTDSLLDQAEERLNLWRRAVGKGPDPDVLEHARRSLEDDLDVPSAIDAIDNAAASGLDVTGPAKLLGVEL